MYELRTDQQAVQKKDPVRKVEGYLRGENPRPPVVLDGKRPYGIINPKTLLNRRVRDNTNVEAITQPVPCIEPDDDTMAALEKFAEALVPYLPVRNEKAGLAGYRLATDLLYELGEGPRASEMGIEGDHLRNDSTIEEAIQKFRETALPALPVRDAAGKLAGQLRRRDLVVTEEYEEQTQGRFDRLGGHEDVREEPIKTWTVPVPRTAPRNADFQTMVTIMRDEGYCILADGDDYVGIVTPARLAQATVKSRAATVPSR